MILTVLTPGATQTPRLEFALGSKPQRLTIGSAEGWEVHGPGVLPVHAVLQFDGLRLHMASVDRASPVIVDGRVLPMTPTQIDSSCNFMIGSVEFRLEMGDPRTKATTVPTVVRSRFPRWSWAVAGVILAGGIATAVRFHGRAARDVSPAPPTPVPAAATVSLPSSPPLNLNTAAAVVHRATHPAVPPGKSKTLERQAADAVHVGDHRRAAELYTELAAQHPANEAFAMAARLLRGG